MLSKLNQLAAHRANLLILADLQRADLALQIKRLHTPLSIIDKGVTAFRFIKQHPLWMLGSAFMLVKSRPKKLIHYLQLGFKILRLTQPSNKP